MNYYASWEVVSYCDLACWHCYSTYEDRPGFSYKPTLGQIQQGLRNMRSAGFGFMNIEGGEPTLRPDVCEIIRACSQAGFETIISTHGLSLRREHLFERLLEAGLDALSLSLDGASPEVDNAVRRRHSGASSHHFEKVSEFMQWFDREKPPVRLKLNVVVMRSNLQDLYDNLGHLLRQWSSHLQVKLVQVHPEGRGRVNYEDLAVTPLEVQALATRVREQALDKDVRIRLHDPHVPYPFVIVAANGEAIVPCGERQETIVAGGRALNVLDEEFAAHFMEWLATNTWFAEGNRRINTYTA